MVDASEKFNFPAFGLVTGFVSASTGNGKAPPYRERKCLVFSVERENVLDGSFIGEGACVKNWFKLEASSSLSGFYIFRGSGMRARICLKALWVISLTAGYATGQTERRALTGPAHLHLSTEIATTADDRRPSSLRVTLKNVGNVTVWMPVLGQECTYVRVKWGGLLEGAACGMSGTPSLTAESVVRDWVELRPGEFMSSTVPVRPPTDERGKEYWVVYEPPQATKQEADELLQAGYVIPTEKVETEHQTYAAR